MKNNDTLTSRLLRLPTIGGMAERRGVAGAASARRRVKGRPLLTPNQKAMRLVLERHYGGDREAMAAALGITGQSIWNYASGIKDPDMKIARRLESVIGRTFSVIETPPDRAIVAFGRCYEPGVPGYELVAQVLHALESHLRGLAERG